MLTAQFSLIPLSPRLNNPIFLNISYCLCFFIYSLQYIHISPVLESMVPIPALPMSQHYWAQGKMMSPYLLPMLLLKQLRILLAFFGHRGIHVAPSMLDMSQDNLVCHRKYARYNLWPGKKYCISVILNFITLPSAISPACLCSSEWQNTIWFVSNFCIVCRLAESVLCTII